MSTVLPSDRRELMQFGVDHTAGWILNASAIGLSNPLALRFKDELGLAQDAFDAATLARTNAKIATQAYYAACATFRTTAGSCVGAIKSFAELSSDPEAIYDLAKIPVPKPRSQTGEPPAQPTNIIAGLNPNGSITLRWKCSNPPGVSRVNYIIQRKLDTQTSFSTLDFVGEKTFTDLTLPRGVDGVSYLITGKAGQQTGPSSSMFTLTFGTVSGGSGTFITSAMEMPEEIKLAA